MNRFQITITSDRIEAITRFQHFLDTNYEEWHRVGIHIDNNFEDSKEYGDYVKFFAEMVDFLEHKEEKKARKQN
tara:strand:- start:29 stop:250 length:222 start_codon:yes stop_codon:yes gene_type:complete